MKQFEVPYNLDPEYPELLRRPALIPYIDCIYLRLGRMTVKTPFDITYRDNYPVL